MSQNSFLLLSQTKAPLIKLEHNYAQLSGEPASRQTLANKAFFKSTPSLAPSIQSSINSSYKNTNENYIDYEFEPIRQKPKSNPNLSAHSRELFTPDSLESTLSSCSLTDSDAENHIVNRDKESLDEEDEQVKSKTDSGISVSPQLTHSSTSEDKHFDLDIDFETDEEICQLTEKNESSVILEKIDKINRLQEKINDINKRIKSIDMNATYSLGDNQSIQQTFDLDFDTQHEKPFDENFRNRNNQTRMGVRGREDNFFDDDEEDENNYIVQARNQINFNMYDDDYSDDDDDDDYVDHKDQYYTVVRQAQPIRKYASTGFLFNRFGSYLAPIEEAPEEVLKSSSNSSLVSTDSSDYLTQSAYISKKTSTSCFNLELRMTNETSETSSPSNQTNLADDSNLAQDLNWSDLVPHSSLLIEREEFVDSSSLIESFNCEKEESQNSGVGGGDGDYVDEDNNNKDESASKVPEDNVERLRNIRDMFENRQEDDLIELKKVEKLQPSEKLKQTFLNNSSSDKHNPTQQQLIVAMNMADINPKSINGDSVCMYEPGSLSASSVASSVPSSPNNDSLNQDNKPTRFEEGVVVNEQEEQEETAKNGNKDIMPFADLNSVKTKFESIGCADEAESSSEPKPVRSITPPREGADRVEIENEPMARAADVVSVYERVEDALPDAGYIKSKREMFSSVSSPSLGDESAPRKKSITPPRDDILKRVLKEKTPDRLENVIRESDRSEDVLPSAGSIRQTAAMFSSGGGARQRSIERSGITIEGELTEKGIAKSRLALFSDPAALSSPPTSHADHDLDLIKNASGIAKERLSLFKNMEQSLNAQRTSPDRSLKKLKEFTPPPQMEPRQYIIVNKEDNEDQLNASCADVSSAYNKDEFVPESGLAKNRMKQYLDQASNSNPNEISISETSELQGKGLAKSMLAKWKSIENIKEEHSPESRRSVEDEVPQAGTAKSLLNKWQNIDTSNEAANRQRKALKAFTPPPPEELARLDQDNDDEQCDDKSKQQAYEDELALLKGAAKNTLKKFESQPVESNINAHYAEEEIIPPQGYAKNLKQKFLNLEKEAAKIETSSAKMNYVPKKFTSTTSPAYNQSKQQTPNSVKQPAASKQQVGKLNATNGLLTTVSNGQNANGQSNGEKCSMCDKTVYAMEKIEADKKVYHKACFKCTSCNCPLNLPSVEIHQNKPYCLDKCKGSNKDLGLIVVDTNCANQNSPKSPKVTSPKTKNVSPSSESQKLLSPSAKSPGALSPKSPSSKSTATSKTASPNPKLSPKPQ